MSTSKQTFSQVKDILRKLDRSIDDAREKRLRPALQAPVAGHDPRAAGPTPVPGGLPNLRHG